MSQFLFKLLFVLALASVFLAAGLAVSKKSIYQQGFLSPFQCGFLPKEILKPNFCSSFFILSLIFLIFDVELILVFPSMVGFQSLSVYSSILILIFINFLVLGLYLEWNVSMLEWFY